MSVKKTSSMDEVESRLSEDARWQLVERILASSGFQRAAQLRQILIYISRYAIVQSNCESPSEYEIACEALERPQGFDPALDNIVRVQMSHLRRRLEAYFSHEGSAEELILTIPKGAYLPVFEAAPSQAEPVSSTAPTDLDPLPPGDLGSDVVRNGIGRLWRFSRIDALRLDWSFREKILLSILVSFICTALIITIFVVHLRDNRFLTDIVKPQVSIFLQPLVKNGAGVSIILPDTSLLVINTVVDQESSVSEYMKSFPGAELANISDPKLRDALRILGSKRSTTFGEATIADNFAKYLAFTGVNATLRYARDMHVDDLRSGNAILLGSRKTNPWQQLFLDQINFRFVRSDATHSNDYFENISPRDGEPAQYVMDTSGKEQVVNYADVVMTPNLSNSGNVLLISGEDVQGTEAAALFLLNGHIPDEIRSVLEHANISSFELFLRGTHIRGEENSHIEVVAFRYKTEK